MRYHHDGLRRMLAMGLIAGTLLQVGCGVGWKNVPHIAPTRFPPRQQVRVWTGETMARLHAVEITGDSLSGVPWLDPPECGECRVQIVVASVDSIQTGDPEGRFLRGLALFYFVFPAAIVAIACAVDGGCGFIYD